MNIDVLYWYQVPTHPWIWVRVYDLGFNKFISFHDTQRYQPCTWGPRWWRWIVDCLFSWKDGEGRIIRHTGVIEPTMTPAQWFTFHTPMRVQEYFRNEHVVTKPEAWWADAVIRQIQALS